MSKYVGALVALAFVVGLAATGAGGAAQGQSNDAFAKSYADLHVTSVSATTQRTSCYRPEVYYDGRLPDAAGYRNGGSSLCPAVAPTSAPFTGEDQGQFQGRYETQDVTNPSLLVKDHSESDIRVDPKHPNHLIGQSKWVVNAEGYNHLLGFYESFDGGATWPVQGHVPGYEGWTDNTDPVGAFDQAGNFYSLVLPYQFYYDKSGGHVYNNGSNQTNPTVPPEAIAVSVRRSTAGTDPNAWITKHDGHPDYVATAKNANTYDPDKQWIGIDTNPNSPCYGTVYAMYTIFKSANPSTVWVSTAKANDDGTHTDWTSAQVLPTVNGKPWDSYLLPHIAPDGTVYTTVTNGNPQQGFAHADVGVIWSKPPDCGQKWQGPLPVVSGINVPTYQNTTFREGIVNTFAVGTHKIDEHTYPLYVAYEDGGSGVSNVWLTASYDHGLHWTAPILVNDNTSPVDELQPNLTVDAGSGKVAVAFYDRRLDCPAAGADAVRAGLADDPNQPFGAKNYCINTAVQFYSWDLQAIGHNVRLSSDTWDPQLSAPHQGCITCRGTFIGDYFGIDSDGANLFTSSVSTFNSAGENPSHYQQQVVAKVAIP